MVFHELRMKNIDTPGKHGNLRISQKIAREFKIPLLRTISIQLIQIPLPGVFDGENRSILATISGVRAVATRHGRFQFVQYTNWDSEQVQSLVPESNGLLDILDVFGLRGVSQR